MVVGLIYKLFTISGKKGLFFLIIVIIPSNNQNSHCRKTYTVPFKNRSEGIISNQLLNVPSELVCNVGQRMLQLINVNQLDYGTSNTL